MGSLVEIFDLLVGIGKGFFVSFHLIFVHGCLSLFSGLVCSSLWVSAGSAGLSWLSWLCGFDDWVWFVEGLEVPFEVLSCFWLAHVEAVGQWVLWLWERLRRCAIQGRQSQGWWIIGVLLLDDVCIRLWHLQMHSCVGMNVFVWLISGWCFEVLVILVDMVRLILDVIVLIIRISIILLAQRASSVDIRIIVVWLMVMLMLNVLIILRCSIELWWDIQSLWYGVEILLLLRQSALMILLRRWGAVSAIELHRWRAVVVLWLLLEVIVVLWRKRWLDSMLVTFLVLDWLFFQTVEIWWQWILLLLTLQVLGVRLLLVLISLLEGLLLGNSRRLLSLCGWLLLLLFLILGRMSIGWCWNRHHIFFTLQIWSRIWWLAKICAFTNQTFCFSKLFLAVDVTCFVIVYQVNEAACIISWVFLLPWRETMACHQNFFVLCDLLGLLLDKLIFWRSFIWTWTTIDLVQGEVDGFLLVGDASILISDAVMMVDAEVVRTDDIASYFSLDVFIVVMILPKHILDVRSIMICCWLRGWATHSLASVPVTCFIFFHHPCLLKRSLIQETHLSLIKCSHEEAIVLELVDFSLVVGYEASTIKLASTSRIIWRNVEKSIEFANKLPHPWVYLIL